MPTRRTLGVIGVALTCPCHAVPLLLLVGGGAGTVWMLQHLGIVIGLLSALFLASLWLLLRPEREGRAGDDTKTRDAAPPERTCARTPMPGLR